MQTPGTRYLRSQVTGAPVTRRRDPTATPAQCFSYYLQVTYSSQKTKLFGPMRCGDAHTSRLCTQ